MGQTPKATDEATGFPAASDAALTMPREGKRRVRRSIELNVRAVPRGFIGSLSEVAAAVSSSRSIDDVLMCVVDEAKVLVPCRKALLWLFGEDDELAPSSEAEVVVVRGSRNQYREEWWRERIRGIAREVAATGTPRLIQEAENDATLACVPVRAHNRTIGLLAAINGRRRSFKEEQIMLLAVLGTFAGSAIENARLRTQSEYALLAGERSRIAKEMHDGLAQSLFSASLALEVCKRRVVAAPAEVEQKLGETQQLLSESLTELRRYIYDLRPVSLDSLGLVEAIRSKVEEVDRAGNIRATLHVEGAVRPLAPSAETCLFRVTQEAIANAMKHAHATQVNVNITYIGEAVELRIEDDGDGFDVEKAVVRAETGSSLGMRSMRDRVTAEDGQLQFRSAPGSGTTVWVMLPC